MNKRIAILLKVVAITKCLLGLVLLLNEIHNYYNLYTVQETDDVLGVHVSMFKYKENCYKNFYLYSLLLITGVSFWINKKLYWGLTQVLLMTIFFVSIIYLWFASYIPIMTRLALSTLTLSVFMFFEIKMYNSLFLKTVEISKRVKVLSVLGGVLSFAIWFLLLAY